jgi:hypothetical protein
MPENNKPPAISISLIRFCSPLRETDEIACCSHEWPVDPPDFFRRRFCDFPAGVVSFCGSETVDLDGASNEGGLSPGAGILNIRRQLGQTMPFPS